MTQILNRNTAKIPKVKNERILQFGGGNFLRGFVDWMIDIYNEKTGSELGILVVKPTERGDYNEWRAQDGLFHVLTKGIKNGKLVDESHLVKCVSRIVHPYKEWKTFLESAENPELQYIISNTTEMGIRFSENDQQTDAPPHEFPAKLTLWLHHRYRHFKGEKSAGCVFIPTELLIDNGSILKETLLQYADFWNLAADFKNWLEEANTFCNTLVDRIIPGIADNKIEETWKSLGFKDAMMTQGEPYHLWVIEAPEKVRKQLPLDKIGLNIIYADDLTPYRTQKVRILNGAHTSMVPVAYLYGIENVREAVEHEVMGKFIHQTIFDNIIPTLAFPIEELQKYANDVLDRFKNPFIRHQLISISLNSVSKFKTRVLPSILTYQNHTGKLPTHLVFSMAALIHFYKGETKNGQNIPLKDDPQAIAFLQNEWKNCDGTSVGFHQMAENILKWEAEWGEDLSNIEDFTKLLALYISMVEHNGMKEAVTDILT